MAKCPSCKRDVLPRSQNPLFPFCSTRCRAVDLGKWLGEEYRVTAGHADGAPEDPAAHPTDPAGEDPEAGH